MLIPFTGAQIVESRAVVGKMRTDLRVTFYLNSFCILLVDVHDDCMCIICIKHAIVIRIGKDTWWIYNLLIVAIIFGLHYVMQWRLESMRMKCLALELVEVGCPVGGVSLQLVFRLIRNWCVPQYYVNVFFNYANKKRNSVVIFSFYSMKKPYSSSPYILFIWEREVSTIYF